MKKSKEFYSSFLDKSREEILLKNIIKKRKLKSIQVIDKTGQR